MTDFKEIFKKDVKVQDDKSRTIEKYKNESYATQSKIGDNTLIQSKVFKQAIEIMGETSGCMDIKAADDKIVE